MEVGCSPTGERLVDFGEKEEITRRGIAHNQGGVIEEGGCFIDYPLNHLFNRGCSLARYWEIGFFVLHVGVEFLEVGGYRPNHKVFGLICRG